MDWQNRLYNIERKLCEHDDEIAARPIMIGSSSGNVVPAVVSDGELLIGLVRGLRYYSDSLIGDGGVTAEWEADPDPFVQQDFQTGIAVAQIYSTGQKILVINDSSNTEAPMDFAVGDRLLVRLSEPVTLSVIASDPVVAITAYPVRMA